MARRRPSGKRLKIGLTRSAAGKIFNAMCKSIESTSWHEGPRTSKHEIELDAATAKSLHAVLGRHLSQPSKKRKKK